MSLKITMYNYLLVQYIINKMSLIYLSEMTDLFKFVKDLLNIPFFNET